MLIPDDTIRKYTMKKDRDVPTAEEVAEVAGANVETAQQALSAVKVDDSSEE